MVLELCREKGKIMKDKNLRNLVIITLFLGVVILGSAVIAGHFGVAPRKTPYFDTKRSYLRSMQMRLYEKLTEKKYDESEILIRRILKIAPENHAMQRVAGKIFYCNGKLNEAETLLRNLLMRNPADILCRNNYAMVLLARKRPEALKELLRAYTDSRGSSFIAGNIAYAEKILKQPAGKIPDDFSEPPIFHTPPLDAVTVPEEKKP